MNKHPDLTKLRMRRKLLQGGLSAAPVLLTIASGPALAGVGNGTGKTASAFCSANATASANAAQAQPCSGGGPAYWYGCRTTPNAWPTGCKTTDNHQSSPCANNHYLQYSANWCYGRSHGAAVAGYCAPGTLSGADKTAYDRKSGAGAKLAAYMTAAMLNCHKGTVPSTIVDLSQLEAIWESLNNTGTWSPMPGYTWTADDVYAWLESLWVQL